MPRTQHTSTLRVLASIALIGACHAAGCATGKGDPDGDGNGKATPGLEQPGTLARPPTSGLPAELRPPR